MWLPGQSRSKSGTFNRQAGHRYWPSARDGAVCVHLGLQVLIKVHNDEQEAAVAAAQAIPGEAVWQLEAPDILPAAGMPANTALTSEQVRVGWAKQGLLWPCCCL